MSLKTFIKSFTSSRWDIGVIVTPLREILAGAEIVVRWITHDFKDSWFADPFVLYADNNVLTLLVEEFYRPIKRGRISRLEVDANQLKVIKRDVILELETHLSFPFYQKLEGKVYIYPENSESGCWKRYIYDDVARRCVYDGVVVDKPLADAVITNVFGENLVFATSMPNPNGNILEVYNCCENQCQLLCKTSFEENVARMSGSFFEYEGKIYRPTQECNVQYGHAVTIQEVTRRGDDFSFKEVRRICSVHPRYKVGMHTFNVFGNLIVTDAMTYDNMWLRKILMALRIIPKR